MASEEKIHYALRAAAEEYGEPLTARRYRLFRKEHSSTAPPYDDLVEHYGGIRAACRAAGVEPAGAGKRVQYTREQLIEALQTAAEQADGPLTKVRYRQHAPQDAPGEQTIRIRLGDGHWEAACDEAGVAAGTDLGSAPRPDWTPATVLAAIGGWMAAQDDPRPSFNSYEQAAEGSGRLPHPRTVREHLGDWPTVLDLLVTEE